MNYRIRGFLRYLKGMLFFALLSFIAWQVTQFFGDIVQDTEKVQKRELLSQGKVSVLYDMDGEEIQKISDADSSQSYVILDKIPESVRQAFVSSMDARFYTHHGLNVQEIIQNIYEGIFEKKKEKVFGATITIQLLQNRLDKEGESGEISLSQRIKEQYLAIALEDDLEKGEILELYLNTINMGDNILGVQAASRYYFGKDVNDVTISEAAVLAAIAKEPVSNNPFTNQSQNNIQRKIVLKKMLDMKKISEPEYEDALGDDVYLRMENKKNKIKNEKNYSYYTDAVLQQVLRDMKDQLGYSQTQAYNTLYRSGVKIFTCQDTGMQEICDEVISAANLRNKKKKASFVLYEQGTGEVKAVVGGRKSGSGSAYAVEEKRQPGTLFDVLSVYVPALDTTGLSLGNVENDASYLMPDTLASINHWQDSNYKGLVTLRQSLRQSLSVPAVKILEDVSIQTGYEYLKRFGITTLVEQKPHNVTEESGNPAESDLQYSMALGKLTEGVTNLEITAAYGAIANQGVYKAPRFYNKVVDSQGNVMLENKSDGRRIMKDTTAWLLTSALRDKENDLSGSGEEKKIFVSGRYALSNEAIDDWYEGYSPYYTGGIWVAGDKKQGKSAKEAKVLWKKIMERVHKQRKISKGSYKKPADIVEADICTKCGNLAVRGLCNKAEGGSAAHREYFASGTQPDKNCTCHVRYMFCEDSRELACDKCPADKTYTRILLEKKETTETEDTPYTVVQNITKDLCSVHGEKKEAD